MISKLPLPQVKPEAVGMSSERLARLRPAMQRFIDQNQVPNIVTLVAREGKIVHFEVQGYADCATQKPVTKDTIFRLYSNTKPITGVAVMILCEEGLLNLNDPVSKYIPAFKNPQVVTWGVPGQNRPLTPNMSIIAPAQREITIRDCLANTTGLATPFTAPPPIKIRFKKLIDESGWDITESLDRPPRKSYRERVEAHARIPLSFEPGTEYTYHLGYPVIGVVIETITGKTLEEFYQEKIFLPLGMKDTSFYLEKSKLKRFSTSYEPSYENGQWGMSVFDKAETSEKVIGPKVHFGAGGDLGGVLSTPADYARYAQMLLNNGEFDGVRILARKSVEILTSDQTGGIPTDEGPGYGFGLGLEVYKGGSPFPVMLSPGSYGKGGACGTIFFADPKEKLLAICFTQKMISNALVDEIGAPTAPDHSYLEEFERLVYQALL
jgi:CubicO group peptidase (beta-lactamase class C family)